MFFVQGDGDGFGTLGDDIKANDPPDEPSDPSPSDNSYGLGTSVQLSVYVSDPEGEDMDVHFYNASNDNQIDFHTGVNNGTYSIDWTGLSNNNRYYWYVVVYDGSNSVTSSTWTFHTSSIDSIDITSSPGGSSVNDKEVSAGFEETVYCSVYNQTEGYIGTAFADWSAEGGNSYLSYGDGREDNRINVGSDPVKVWLNTTYSNFQDTVVYTVKPPTVDMVEIVDQQNKGSMMIQDVSLPIDSTLSGYSAGFNDSVGYLKDVSVEWSVINYETTGETSPSVADYSVLDVGGQPGTLMWKAEFDTGISDVVNVDVYDEDPPKVEDMTSGNPTTGDPFTLSVNVTDDVRVDEVFVEYSFDGGGYLNDSMIHGKNNWTYDLNVPSSADYLEYIFNVNDTSNNWNSTGNTNLTVVDNDPPSIIDTTSGVPETGESFNITADVSDNKGVKDVFLNYTVFTAGGGESNKEVAMDGEYHKEILVPNDATDISYRIYAKDSSGNWEETTSTVIQVDDTEKPSITDTTVGEPTTGDYFQITADIYDNVDISDAFVNYTIKSKSGFTRSKSIRMYPGYYRDIPIWSNATEFSYHLSAKDTSNNWDTGPKNYITVIDNDGPAIEDSSGSQITTGEEYVLKASVSDNMLVQDVFVRYWTDTTPINNISMDQDLSGIYEKPIFIPDDCTTLYYNFIAVDDSSNWAETGELSSDVYDNDSPKVEITTGSKPRTGNYYNITASVTDNTGIESVWVNYTIVDIDGNNENNNITMDEGSYHKEIFLPKDSVSVDYHVSAVDKDRNWNRSEDVYQDVVDDDEPIVSLNMEDRPVNGEDYLINITVTDNIGLKDVVITYWTDVTSPTKSSMISGGDDLYLKNIHVPIDTGNLYFNFTAFDNSNNTNETKTYDKAVLDENPPDIGSLEISPEPCYVHLETNLACEITDNRGVSSAHITIYDPEGDEIGNYTMDPYSEPETFCYSEQFEQSGNYSYMISAVDLSHNWASTESKNLQINPPKVDYILIRNQSLNGGSPLNNITLQINESATLYAAGYNETHGYQGDLRVSWASSNNEAMVVDNEYGRVTNCTPTGYGSGKVYAIYDSMQTSIDFRIIEPQQPEIIDHIPDLQFEEDFGIHQLNLSKYASDLQDPKSSLKWYITGLDEDVMTLAGENLTGNHVLTLISQKNKFKDMKVRYWLEDMDGNRDFQIAWINVTSQNDPPQFKEFPDLYIRYDDPYVFNYHPYITDSDSPISDIELETDDAAFTTVEGFNVTYEYPEDMVNQTVYVTLTASDGSESTSRVVRVTITADYPPENVRHIPDITLKENETIKNAFDLDDFIQDPDEDSLYMSYGYTHLDITIHKNHSVDIKAPKFWNGFERVTFRATDPIGAVVEQTINVTVTPVNSPPKIKSLPPFVVHYDHPYTFDLRWYISDPDNSINELEITTSNPSNISVIGTTLRMVYPEKYQSMEYPYTVPLTVYVSDGVNSTFTVTSVTVTDDYPPEVLEPLDDIIFDEDGSVENAFDLDEHFRDRDSDTIYYTSGNENIIVDINENNTVDLSAPPDWYGSELIKIRATDNDGALMEDTFTVYVLPVNDAPEIEDIPDQEGVVGEDWVLDLNSYIEDDDNDLNELSISVDTSNILVAGHKLIFIYPKEPMNETVSVSVSDGSLQNSTTFKVTILEPPSEESRSLLDSPYIYTPIPVVLFLFGLAYYLKKSEYTVDDIFLIHDSGILIKHKTREMKAERDEDILAGMFTAVQNFVKDAFAEEEEESLKRMDYGDKKVLIQKGNHVSLAVFFTGEEPKWALESMENLVKDIEERYDEVIDDWSGNIEDLPGITKMLNTLFKKGKYKRGDWEKLKE